MSETPVLKILFGSADDESNALLKKLFDQHSIHHVLLETDINNFIWMVSSFVPDLIITGFEWWQNTTGLDLLTQLRKDNNIQLVIWTDVINENIITAAFQYTNVHFIRKNQSENILIDTVRKVKPISITNQ